NNSWGGSMSVHAQDTGRIFGRQIKLACGVRWSQIGAFIFLSFSIVFLPGTASAQTAGVVHHLAATPQTITWGYFDAHKAPVLRIKSGDTVEVQTLVAESIGRLKAAGVPADQIQPVLRDIDREVKNPGLGPHILTGPIWIEGAEPGDVLEVKVKSIHLAIPYAVNEMRPGNGLLPDEFPYARFKVTPLDRAHNVAKFSDGVEIPIRPFFGVMGVAPPAATGRVSSGPPWMFGGNLDNKELVAGSTVYLPVFTNGALFEVGDGHAGMGDGEVCVSALETSLQGTLQFFVRKDIKILWPRAETPQYYITMGFAPSLEESAKIALREMLDYLVTQKHLSRDNAYILASDAVDFHIEEAVDGNLGVDDLLPKDIFVH
ncbi:MAG: acetamidase/formamidase family protein, partial [Terriglobia bacterium]